MEMPVELCGFVVPCTLMAYLKFKLEHSINIVNKSYLFHF
jgi:hypothetical protein